MAIGDDAIAAGMDLVPGSAPANTLDTEDNKTRDYIAQRTDPPGTPRAIAKGGTGGNSASAARANLGVPAKAEVILRSGANVITLYWNGSRLNANIDGIEVGTLGYFSDIGTALGQALASYLPLSGGTINGALGVVGSLFVPNAGPATQGWQVAYINSDGRLSKGSSSERYKKYISAIDPGSLGDVWPEIQRYQMRQGDGEWKYGYIAEKLDANPDQSPFVVYDKDGRPDSIDFISLVMVQNAQLHQALDLLAQRVEALEVNRD